MPEDKAPLLKARPLKDTCSKCGAKPPEVGVDKGHIARFQMICVCGLKLDYGVVPGSRYEPAKA